MVEIMIYIIYIYTKKKSSEGIKENIQFMSYKTIMSSLLRAGSKLYDIPRLCFPDLRVWVWREVCLFYTLVKIMLCAFRLYLSIKITFNSVRVTRLRTLIYFYFKIIGLTNQPVLTLIKVLFFHMLCHNIFWSFLIIFRRHHNSLKEVNQALLAWPPLYLVLQSFLSSGDRFESVQNFAWKLEAMNLW